MPHLLDKKNMEMLTRHKVFTEAELKSRCDIMLDNYCKTVVIEANTMADMAKTQILPAVESYSEAVARTAAVKKSLDADIACDFEKTLVKKLSELALKIYKGSDCLKRAVMQLADAKDIIDESEMIRDTVLPAMGELRVPCDEAEKLTAKSFWPFPTYGDILFSVD